MKNSPMQRPNPFRMTFAGAFCALTLGGVAQAEQTQVSLYGILDQGFGYTSNVGGESLWRMQSGAASGNRWGLQVREALGDGWQAFATLENGFDANNGRLGQGGRMFGRQAFLGLGKRDLGQLSLGRQYDAVNDTLTLVTANGTWATGVNGHMFDNDNTGSSYRVNNTVKYASPSFAGMEVVASYSFANTAGTSGNQAYSIGGLYTNGPLKAGLAYAQLDRPGTTLNGGIDPGETNPLGGKRRIWGGGLMYDIGAWTLGTAYTHSRYADLRGWPGGGAFGQMGGSGLRFDNMEVSANYRWNPALTTGLAYVYTRGRTDPGNGDVRHPQWHQIGAVADYFLSKRTDVYALAGYQQRTGGSVNAGNLDSARSELIGLSSSNRHQITAHIGIRHRF